MEEDQELKEMEQQVRNIVLSEARRLGPRIGVVAKNDTDLMEKFNDKITVYLQKRRIAFDEDNHYLVTDKGKKLKMSTGVLTIYLMDALKMLEKPLKADEILSWLFTMDQDVFKKGFLSHDHEMQNILLPAIERAKKVVHKDAMNPNSLALIPVSLKEAQKNASSPRLQETFTEYILQITKEGVFPEKIVIDGRFCDDIDKNKLADLCKRGLISKNILLESKSLKGIGKEQLDDLMENGVLKDISPEEIAKLYANGFINEKNALMLYEDGRLSKEDALKIFGGPSNIVKQFEKNKKKNKSLANKYFSLLGDEDICNLYIEGKISSNTFEKAGIKKETIETLPEDTFVDLAKKGFPNGITFESDELVKKYGNDLSGSALIKLAEYGYVDQTKPLELLNTPVKDETKKIQSKDLIGLYTPQNLAEILKQNEIGYKFVEQLNTEVLSGLDEKRRERYMQQFVASCHDMDNDVYAKTMLKLIQDGVLPEKTWQEVKPSSNAVANMLLDESLSEEEAVDYFNKGILNGYVIDQVYGKHYDKIIEDIKAKKLSGKAYLKVPNKVIHDSFDIEMLDPEDVFEIYADYDGIECSELAQMLIEAGKKNDKRIHVVGMLENDKTLKGDNLNQKVKELFWNKVLSHSELYELQEKGIIDAKTRKETEELGLAREFEDMFSDNKKTLESLSEDYNKDEGEIVPLAGEGDSKKAPTIEIPMHKRVEFFHRLGASAYKNIEAPSTDDEQKGSFSNYIAFAFPKYGCIILESDKPKNATYLLTMQEFKTYIEEVESSNTIAFTMSKTALREDFSKRTKAFDFRNHTLEWGQNVIKSLKQISEVAKDTISDEKAKELSDEMKHEYEKARKEAVEEEFGDSENTKSALALRIAKDDYVVAADKLNEISPKQRKNKTIQKQTSDFTR